MAGRSEEIAAFLFKSSLFTKKQNAWAGPDHWKYHKPKGRYWDQNNIIYDHFTCSVEGF